MNIHQVTITPSEHMPGIAFATCSAGDFLISGTARAVIEDADRHCADHASEVN
jgi:hypothetical protein